MPVTAEAGAGTGTGAVGAVGVVTGASTTFLRGDPSVWIADAFDRNF